MKKGTTLQEIWQFKLGEAMSKDKSDDRLESAKEHISAALSELADYLNEEIPALTDKGIDAVEDLISVGAEKAQESLNKISDALEKVKKEK